MTRPPPRRGAAQTAAHFRREIQQAQADGVACEAMTLHLTLSDASHLKRDRSVAIEDIRFVDGHMTYLGVKILEGGVAESVLIRG